MFLNGINNFLMVERASERPNIQVDLSVSTMKTVTKIKGILHIVHMNIMMMVVTVITDKETVSKILHYKLNTKKICVKLVPKNLTPDQIFVLQQTCSDFLERLDEEPELMKNIITCDQTWVF